eukprot:TRINITY_DN256_c0_g1_i1.p1 TRINITY_DN256_c0_g1~~TRINITY_DN256_c0_g1_i1.p1  ORF type:complete len:252 (-),score=56.33 TRINITY_DN256_c0_g1_i1:58-813(-)
MEEKKMKEEEIVIQEKISVVQKISPNEENKPTKKRELKRDLENLINNNNSFTVQKIPKIEEKFKIMADKMELSNKFLNKKDADYYLEELYKHMEWVQEEIKMMGKTLKPMRLICINGDNNLSYRYSGIKKIAPGWNETLHELKKKAEEFCGEKFNFALVNLYRNGEDYIGPHSDDTRDLVPGSSVVSVTLGAERDFVVKRKTDKKTFIFPLPHGSMLVMKDGAQKTYKHSVPKRKKITNKRINITFRHVSC